MRIFSLVALALLAGCASVDRTPCFTEASKSRANFELARYLRLPPDRPIQRDAGYEVIVHCTQSGEALSCAPLHPQGDSFEQAAVVYAQHLQLCPGHTGPVGFAVYVPDH